MAPTVCTPARGLSGESGDIRTLPRSAFVGPKTSWRRTKGAHGDQLNFLTQSKWDTWPSPSYCRSGDFSNQSGLPPSGQRAERIGRKLPRWRMKRVSAGKKEVMGAEEEAQVLSLKLSLGAMWGPWCHGPVFTGFGCNRQREIYFLCPQHNQVYTRGSSGVAVLWTPVSRTPGIQSSHPPIYAHPLTSPAI